jgi:cytochrome b subunit of formate dehydrogenase
MSRLDKAKEYLNTLRVGLSILSAFIMALGGGAGSMYNAGNFGTMFWFSVVTMALCIASGFVIIKKIKEKTEEIEDL